MQKKRYKILDIYPDDSWKCSDERKHFIGAEFEGEILLPTAAHDPNPKLTEEGWIAFFGQRIWKGKCVWGKFKFFRYVKVEII